MLKHNNINSPGFFEPGVFRYKDTNEPFRGTPTTIKLGADVQYFDGSGRELLPGTKEQPQPTEAELFYNHTWRRQ